MSSRAKPPLKRRRVLRPKRRFVQRPDIRARLLDAAEALFREEGYAAATARRIASEVDMKHQVVSYYFNSHDDLLLALFRRMAESHREKLTAALDSEHPLSSMWAVISDPDATKLGLEFMALANHNSAVRAEIASNAEAVRTLEADGVARYLKKRGIQPRLSPELVSILTNAVARLLVQETTLGIRMGHEEAEALIDNSFRAFEGRGDTDAGVASLVDAMSSSE
jgi:TetR/AcrR family transcriptional regulator, regulator of autoinduction and epiphytic fitness